MSETQTYEGGWQPTEPEREPSKGPAISDFFVTGLVANTQSHGFYITNEPRRPKTQADYECQMAWLEQCARNGSKIPPVVATKMLEGLPSSDPLWQRLGKLFRPLSSPAPTEEG